ncbi:3-phenylpropionate/cinnamic acid dioxygenase subunit beta [Streptomyces sp. ME19-01-6]|uniref:3-phenylpropionate/cinnamic acid dioxygenase subunit beta n=1 Tax=Streptomyces sp. ME19-01-6 TaxID=3028686 RepID=UPI0029B3282C|nr:3-phenylpropionate/cinnamic acid dioxygenase subunit beta [Streptomyces sp. ME19-01-6]MDX3233914.1 3-phenylpropionate/cinnamic acid dioxygenase subunit beta [Streptomyces sp. ME19-01-6]
MTATNVNAAEALVAMGPEPAVPADTERRVRHFLHYESWLLDERRFRDWVDLFTEDARYELPVRVNREEGQEAFSRSRAFDDNKQTLEIRVERLHTEFAWSEQPPSRVRHYVANVMVAPGRASDEFHVVSNELVFRSRGDSVAYDLLSAQRVDCLRDSPNGLRISRRLVMLDQTTLGAHNLSMFF